MADSDYIRTPGPETQTNDPFFTVTPAATGAPAASSGGYGYAGGIATAAGGIASAYATYKSGQTQKKIARFNARYAKQQAAQAIQAGEFTANRVAQHERQVEAAGRAAAASSGVVAGAGSQHFIAESNRAAADMDRRMIDLNARREAYGFTVKAQGDTIAGRLAESSANAGAVSTLLNTGSKLWMQSDQTPITFT